MVYVSCSDAAAYASWAGKRLPTEAEWEYAARGGLIGQRYPRGNEITMENAHYAGMDGSSRVGSYSPNVQAHQTESLCILGIWCELLS
jgi:formylglycine-generating enzyme required for sulfatase activity